MSKVSSKIVYNWTDISQTCPEFSPNYVDIILAIFAIAGFILSCMLIAKFRKQLKGSVSVFSLSFVDMSYCLLYLYNFPLKSLVFYLESDFMANVRHKAQHQIETIEEFGNFFIPILMMYIVLEKFLWTCSPRTRYSLRLFTMDRPKFILTAVTAGVGIVVAVISTWNLVILHVHFCDVVLLPFAFTNKFLNTIQRIVIPLTIALSVPISFIFALITLCRIGKVGKGENPVDQEAVNLGNEEVNGAVRVITSLVKKSILCMLTFYFLFFLREVCYFAFVRQHTKGVFASNRHHRIMYSWYYDFSSVVLSGSRYLIYYIFCRHEVVVNFPPNALGSL
ncbi:hypothetical protein B9Z55_020635 [Caenorhabditis nigoni]|uniref:G-protein coupled receptors family 1 profile domain-containing protein n=1 Tax=Caenorhabditis nigoni TaxID=1611254 RepID=A0A2G5TNG3_9PELO|nr:hypothetical protein B9Z55_020635 [Caenorhabditis nigoni]